MNTKNSIYGKWLWLQITYGITWLALQPKVTFLSLFLSSCSWGQCILNPAPNTHFLVNVMYIFGSNEWRVDFMYSSVYCIYTVVYIWYWIFICLTVCLCLSLSKKISAHSYCSSWVLPFECAVLDLENMICTREGWFITSITILYNAEW